jgi:hypothetical protein
MSEAAMKQEPDNQEGYAAEMVQKLAENIKSEIPFPKTTPQPVDSVLVDFLRAQVTDFDSSIAQLDESISVMQQRRAEYHRARSRCMAALDLSVDTKVIEA